MTAMRFPRATLLLTLLTLGTGAWAQGFHPGIAARVNGVEISNERFDAFYQEYRRPYGINVAGRGDHLQRLTKLRREAMDLMVEQELIRQAAEKQGIQVTADEIDAAVAEISEPFKTPEEFARRIQSEGFTEESYRKHVERMLAAKQYLDGIRAAVPAVSDEQLETYYRDNEVRLTLPEPWTCAPSAQKGWPLPAARRAGPCPGWNAPTERPGRAGRPGWLPGSVRRRYGARCGDSPHRGLPGERTFPGCG